MSPGSMLTMGAMGNKHEIGDAGPDKSILILLMHGLHYLWPEDVIRASASPCNKGLQAAEAQA